MFNIKPAFEKGTNQWVIKEIKWKVPIQSMTHLDLKEKANKFQVFLFFNLDKQNKLLQAAGEPKMKKSERDLDFYDIVVCRDFLFHVKRLHHYHNCAGVNNKEPPLKVELKR